MQVISALWALLTMVKIPFDWFRIDIEPLSVPKHTSRLLGIRIPAVAFPIFSDG